MTTPTKVCIIKTMIIFDKEKFANNLRELKLSYPKFVRQLEIKTGLKISSEAIRKIVKGRTLFPRTNTSLAIAKFFTTDINSWFKEEKQNGMPV